MRAPPMIIVKITGKDSFKMTFVQHDDIVQAISPINLYPAYLDFFLSITPDYNFVLSCFSSTSSQSYLSLHS